MATNLEGDYSKYPEVTREAFSRIAGETCDLRQTWLIYHRLFMDDERLTQVMSEQFGPLFGVLQAALEDLLFLSVSRLTDKDNPRQPNLSVWTLKARAYDILREKGTIAPGEWRRLWNQLSEGSGT